MHAASRTLRPSHPTRYRAILAALAAAALAAGAAAPAGAASNPPRMNDADVGPFLQFSPWYAVNAVDEAHCKGTGPAYKGPSKTTEHSAYSCTVEYGDEMKTVITAKVLGPEWLQITGLKAVPLGPIPTAPKLLVSDVAADDLADSAWGEKNQVDEAECDGIGPYVVKNDYDLYGAFECTSTKEGAEGPAVVIKVVNASTVRVTKTLYAGYKIP